MRIYSRKQSWPLISRLIASFMISFSVVNKLSTFFFWRNSLLDVFFDALHDFLWGLRPRSFIKWGFKHSLCNSEIFRIHFFQEGNPTRIVNLWLFGFSWLFVVYFELYKIVFRYSQNSLFPGCPLRRFPWFSLRTLSKIL